MGTTGLSSQAQLLPYMEDAAVVNLVDQSVHWRDQTHPGQDNAAAILQMPEPGAVGIDGSFSHQAAFEDSPLRCHYFAIFGAKPDSCGTVLARSAQPPCLRPKTPTR